MNAPKIKRILFDGGSSLGDFLTRDKTLRIEGTSNAGAKITIFDNNAKIGKAKADKKGKWAFDTAGLSDGQHSFKAKAKLDGATSSSSTPFSGAIDTIAPAKPGIHLAASSDSGVSSSDGLTNDATPTLTGTAEAGATVIIRDNGNVLATLLADGSGHWSFTTGVLGNGGHSLTATATDKAGNIGAAASALVVTVDTARPSAPGGLDLAMADDSGIVHNDNLTNKTSGLTISGSGESGATVTLFDDADNDGVKDGGETVLATALVSGGAFSTDVALGAGLHHVRTFQTDVAGNAGAVSSVLNVTVDITPPSAPTITGFADDTGDIGDHLTLDQTLVISGTAAADSTVSVFDGAALLGTATANGSGNWSFPTATLASGTHSFTASAIDDAGNVAASNALVVQVGVDIDAATMTTADGFRIFGADSRDYAGYSVSSAGDINGDGFDDMIVGVLARLGGGPANDRAYAGETIVVFGKVGGFADVDVATMTAADGFRIFGADGQYSGRSVSSVGDINGDGFDDLIVVATRGGGPTDDRPSAGEAIVVFGKASGFADIDVATMTAADGFRIFGADSYDGAGISVSSAGDINRDGFDDVIVGANGADGPTNARSNAGEAIVVFGKAGGFANVDVATMTAATGFRIFGADSHDYAGYSVSSAGDINGDGFDDLIVGATGADGPANGRAYAGEAIVVFGKAGGFGDIDVSTMTASDGFRIFGADGLDFAGTSVSSAGDINGDGFDDVMVGAYLADGPANDEIFAGEAIVVFGKAGGFTDIDVSTMTAADGFRIFGADTEDYAGRSVASAGDINGDGFDDLLVGARGGAGPTNGRGGAGEAIVVFGKAGGFADIDVATMTATDGFRIFGADTGDNAGFSVSSAGDIDGDGFDDLIVGAKGGDGPANGRDRAGEAIVVFGGDFLDGVVQLGTNGPETLTGTAAAETFVGGRGDDLMLGNGGADAFQGGEGNDTIAVTGPAALRRADGGAGLDTIKATGSGAAFDFSSILPATIASIEAFDLTGTGNNSLTLSARDLFDISNARSGGITTLIVHGNAGDSVATLDTGWTNSGTTTIGPDTFTIYQHGQARLLVDADISAGGILA